MSRFSRGCLAAFVFVLLAGRLQAEPRFAGTWESTFGLMYLNEDEAKVSGFYNQGGAFCKIEGSLKDARWTFNYQEPLVRGEGHFDIADDGQTINGKWRPFGTEAWHPWTGRRAPSVAKPGNYAGVWSTSFGRMRLTTNEDTVSGCYAFPPGATISGKLTGNRLAFEYHEPGVEGEGSFVLAEDGRSFQGKWRPAGTEPWLDWYGVRVEPVPGRRWLVIVEAHWEHDLAEPEYSFGAMLRSFFARSPHVQVRHRFISSAQDVAQACHEVTYLTEPVVLVIASHGTGEGIAVKGQIVGATTFAQSLKHAPNVQLMHFSSCSVMGEDLPQDIMDSRERTLRFPISGYTQPVDWAGSAVLEFLYFDMILSRGLPPAKAAQQVRLLMPFANDAPVRGAVIPPAGFRILLPTDK